MCVLHPCLVLLCLYVCVYLYLQIQGPLQECHSIRQSASGLPYYWTPLVCVPEVMELLAVWRHNKPKTKNQKPISSLIPAYVYLNMYTHFPPLPYSYIFIAEFICMLCVLFYIYKHLLVFFLAFLQI